MTPQHGHDEVVNGRNGFVNVVETKWLKFNLNYLLSKQGWSCGLASFEKILVGEEVGFIHKKSSVEVKRGWVSHFLHRPLDFVRALLAVTNLVLRGVNRLDFADDASLILENLAMVFGNIRQDSYNERVDGFDLSETLCQSNHTFPIVSITGQERHECPLGSIGRLDGSFGGSRRHIDYEECEKGDDRLLMLLVDNGDGEIALSGTRNSYVLFSTQHTSPIDVVFSGHRCTTPKSSSAIHSAASTSSTLPAQL
ncbi:hypothetical protein SDJN02_12870, partial [Cucurbita argyrosperma subsp. argyrosperma]